MSTIISNFLKRGWNSPTLMTWGNLLSSSGKLLILTPLILIKYNIDEIAFWYLLLTINSFVVVVDFGFYPSFSRIISFVFHGLGEISDISDKTKVNNTGKSEWNFMERIYGTINSTYFFLSFLVVLVIVLASYGPINTIISRTHQEPVLWSSYSIFIISVVFSFFARRSDTIIIGTNHVALINRWNIINNLVNSFSSILIVYCGLGIEWLAINQLFFSVLLIIRNYYLEIIICNGRFKHFKMFNFDLDIFKWVWGPTWKSGVGILASTGLTQVTGLVYTSMSTSAELASYLITLKLVTTISQFSQAPFYSKIPLFSGLRVKNKIRDLSNRSMSAMFQSLMVFVFGISFLFFLGDYLLLIIGSNTDLESPSFIVFMAFIWFFERHHAMHAQIYSTTNKIPFYKMLIISGSINICLMYVLVPKIGVWGFPTSLAISNIVINNWWNVKISLNSIQQKFIPYFIRSGLVPLIILVVLSIIRIFLF
jgi:O-antigen/teichoic acid export membrane protein